MKMMFYLVFLFVAFIAVSNGGLLDGVDEEKDAEFIEFICGISDADRQYIWNCIKGIDDDFVRAEGCFDKIGVTSGNEFLKLICSPNFTEEQDLEFETCVGPVAELTQDQVADVALNCILPILIKYQNRQQ